MKIKMKNKTFNILLIIVMTFFCISTLNLLESKGYTTVHAEEIVYHGLKGDYYKGSSNTSADFASLVSTHIDETVNFYNGFTDILKERTGQTEGCSVRWTGKIQPKYSEDYTFYLVGDNGFKLWIDGKLIIDHWLNDWEVPQTSSKISLQAGTQYDFKLEYFQAIGGADLKLQWSSQSQIKQVIPVDCLYQPGDSKVPIVTSSIEPLAVTSQQYSHPTLASTVTVKYSDGTKKQLPVTWDLSDMSLFSQVGKVTVSGNVTGTTAEAIAVVTVVPYAGWQKQKAALMTKWASQVTPESALPEYPRMQMQRKDWQNLNGLWQFDQGTANDVVPVGKDLKREILVPYPMESALSGVMTHYDRSWYKKSFTVPKNWRQKKIILNFGAVDWESEVFINGTSVGTHKGGYDPFSYDITQYLKGTGPQELIVRVYDPTDATGEPRGKQTLHPGGIMYTATSGIWQTVWIEPVATTSSIDNLKIEPDVDASRLKLTVNTIGVATGTTITATAKDGTRVIGTVKGSSNTILYIPIPNAKLWSPDNPFLYDLTVDLKKDARTIDTVNSYFGMRKMSMSLINGENKLLLNNKETFLMGPLDQGFWPDGLYTAPTDAALKYDIEKEKALGFNMVRKHIKVEPSRWYYWADKLGIMVWQDMPSANSYMGNPPPVDKAEYELELKRMVLNLFNSPSIIMWCIFNEDQGQYEPARLVELVANLDSSRLINQGSGGPYANAGNIYDLHSYPQPTSPNSTTQAEVCGEYGGVGLKVENHQWNASGSASYIMVNTPEELTNIYDTYANNLLSYKTNNGLSAAVYTEITDVETEVNGLMTYDRIMKCDVSKIKASNNKIINKQISFSDILPVSQKQIQTWKYTTAAAASDWYSTSYNDASWTLGQGGFGTKITPGIPIGTTWDTSDIWLRKTFNPGTLTKTDINNLCFNVFHDEDCEIYINGVLAGSATGYSKEYIILEMNQAGKNAIISNGNNVIAVHCHQTVGGQGIDVGIGKRVISDPPMPSSNFTANFNDGTSSQWNIFGGNWSVKDNKYVVASNPGAKSIATNTNFSDFTYETDLKIGANQPNSNAGVLFRLNSPGVGADNFKGYYAGIGENGNDAGVILGKSNGSWTALSFQPMTIDPTKSYHIKVMTLGSSIKVYVNNMDTPIIDTVDNSYISGSIGLRTWNVDAEYDNVSVTSKAIMDKDATLKEITVDEKVMADFKGDLINTVTVPYTTKIPKVAAAATNVNAKVTVKQACSLNSYAAIHVTSVDGKNNQIYKVYFKVLQNTDAILKGIKVDEKDTDSTQQGLVVEETK
ncbi:MAG: DUF1080 domain-containing protein [Clostridiaceae bacterium]|nr:DUF1080 domain-containing protein [Clostridiaceae bacterium]